MHTRTVTSTSKYACRMKKWLVSPWQWLPLYGCNAWLTDKCANTPVETFRIEPVFVKAILVKAVLVQALAVEALPEGRSTIRNTLELDCVNREALCLV